MSQDPGELLRSHGLRSTPQRRAILRAFRGTSDEHLSADEVLSRAAALVPDLGRGTVYATLAELTELGMLAAVGNPEAVRYETNLVAHDHFQCRLCLRLFDVDLGGAEIDRSRLTGYEIETIAVRAYGVCADCHDFARGMREGAEQVLEAPSLTVSALDYLACLCVDSPLGELGLVASTEGIVHVAFASHAAFDAIHERGSRRGPAGARARARELAESIDRYFGGFRGPAPDMIDWRLANDLHRDTLAAVQAIGYAETLSYRGLGDALGAYDCGHLMGTNPLPLLVPCHRVNWGSIPPRWYVGGLEARETLRALEAGAGPGR